MAAATAAAAMALLAIVTQDQAALRAAPASAAPVHAQLTAGDLLEVRGQRLDHLQVYDHRRERAGYIRAVQVRAFSGSEAEAPQLLAVLRFLRDTPGAESLGIAYVAAYLKAAPAGSIGAEPFDALGVMAERLARRAGSKAGQATAALDAVGAYGVKFNSHERNGQVQLCYDGDAFRRVLALNGSPEQRARAALALTRHDCLDPALKTHERQAVDRWRAGLLDAFSPSDNSALDELSKNRLHLRRAGVWAAIAFGNSRRGEPAEASAQHALDALAAVNRNELGDDEQAELNEAAIRVGAVRWAAMQAPVAPAGKLQVKLAAGEPGQTCVQLHPAPVPPGAAPLAQRCTFGTVWAASAQPSADGRGLALAVQPLEGWSELWVFRASEAGWSVDVLPPANAEPGLGYVEFAGWAPGPKRRLLLAREAKVDGRTSRRFEVLDADTLALDKSASTPQLLAAFGPWAAPVWKKTTLSLR
ncbi:hypothetical protein BurJ1DRAFT_4917 [Burkholderiales bacterium JOSHI_001]|nr:hypothetical protein BurJ1DRAFT_4917 [Burkholderiales bacterium JOSHI_001]